MSDADDITLDEWYAEMEAIQTDAQAVGHSTAELAEHFHMSRKRVCAHLRKLMAAGRLTVHHKSVTRLDGQVARIPVYQLKKNS